MINPGTKKKAIAVSAEATNMNQEKARVPEEFIVLTYPRKSVVLLLDFIAKGGNGSLLDSFRRSAARQIKGKQKSPSLLAQAGAGGRVSFTAV